MNDDLVRYGEKVISLCTSMGATECECCIEERIEKTILMEKEEIKSEREKHETTMGIRLLKGKKKGFSSSTLPGDAEKIANYALNCAVHAEDDEHWNQLPSPQPVAPVQDIYDPELADITLDQLIDRSSLLVSPYPDVFLDTAKVTVSTVYFYIINSQGVDYDYTATKWYIFVSYLPRKGTAYSALDYAVSRHMDIDCGHLAEMTAREVRNSLKATQLKDSFKGDVIFSENVCSQIFMNSLAAAANAENFRHQMSAFEGKMGEQVVSPNITLTDNGLIPKGVCSSPVDREGTPCEKTPVIAKGILENILHDSYTASLFDTKSTGNAVGSAMTPPVVGISNLVLCPGSHSTEDIIESVKKGLYIKGLSGGTDVTTGNFSGVVHHGYYIENGEIKFPVHCLISGNSFSSLHTINYLGKEQKANLEGMYAVPILVEGISIIPG